MSFAVQVFTALAGPSIAFSCLDVQVTSIAFDSHPKHGVLVLAEGLGLRGPALVGLAIALAWFAVQVT